MSVRPYMIGLGQYLADGGVKASAAVTGGSMTLIESDTDGGAPPHVHEREDEAMYVLEGEITVHCGEQTFHVGPRGFVFMPRGQLHDWDVEGERAIVLIMASPGGLEEFLADFHAATDWAGRDAVAEQYGLRFPR
jgi:mannose-6-phosphate isomerase-like protein (cupin superfamily)